jgi:hypothetical protein
MVNLLGETNAPTKPRPTTSASTSTENLDVFVTGVQLPKPSPKPTPKPTPNSVFGVIASDLIDAIKPKAPTPTPIIPQKNDDVLDAYGSPKTEDENTCPEGYTKNYNRQGKLECLPNYNDIADCGSPTMCTEDEEFVDCKCQKKTTSPQTPNTPTTPTQVTKNLKPLIYGVGIIVGIIIISKLLKSN